jgi:hypothetical protein
MKAGSLLLAKRKATHSQAKYLCPKAVNLLYFPSKAIMLEEEESPLGWKLFKGVETYSKT